MGSNMNWAKLCSDCVMPCVNLTKLNRLGVWEEETCTMERLNLSQARVADQKRIKPSQAGAADQKLWEGGEDDLNCGN